MLRAWTVFGVLVCLSLTAVARGESTYVKFLKSGRVPAERMGGVLSLIGKNGDADDLAYVLEQATKADGFPATAKPAALAALLDAATARNIKPSGDLNVLRKLVAETDPAQAAARATALELVGLWKLSAATPDIEKLLADKQSSASLRKQALVALGQIGGKDAEATFRKLAGAENPIDARLLAVAGLANISAKQAVVPAVAVLANVKGDADPAPLLDAFLAQKQGASELARGVKGSKKIPADAAKLALRHMYSVGRADEELVAAFSAIAGISTEVKPLTPDQLKKLVAEVNAKGNAQRGETLFRRGDLSCMKCHAVSGGGGDIGPDLSALGQSSPVDYVITSIMTPELSVKEHYQLAKVITSEGKVLVGIIAEDNEDRLVLKDGEGKKIIVPKDGVEEIVRGGSLMPKGLANFLTDAEFLDIVKFISELGKPGEYAIRTQPTVQRWRLLAPTPDKPGRDVPNEQTFRDDILGGKTWQPAYAKVAGQLPLADLTKPAANTTLFLQAEINVTTEGNVVVECGDGGGVTIWLDETPLVLLEGKATAEASTGVHKITFRIDTTKRDAKELRVLVKPASESPAEYTVVGGP